VQPLCKAVTWTLSMIDGARSTRQGGCANLLWCNRHASENFRNLNGLAVSRGVSGATCCRPATAGKPPPAGCGH
jgi:hypothetical protein